MELAFQKPVCLPCCSRDNCLDVILGCLLPLVWLGFHLPKNRFFTSNCTFPKIYLGNKGNRQKNDGIDYLAYKCTYLFYVTYLVT